MNFTKNIWLTQIQGNSSSAYIMVYYYFDNPKRIAGTILKNDYSGSITYLEGTTYYSLTIPRTSLSLNLGYNNKLGGNSRTQGNFSFSSIISILNIELPQFDYDCEYYPS